MRRGHRARQHFRQLTDSLRNEKWNQDKLKSEKLRQDWKNVEEELQHKAHRDSIKRQDEGKGDTSADAAEAVSLQSSEQKENDTAGAPLEELEPSSSSSALPSSSSSPPPPAAAVTAAAVTGESDEEMIAAKEVMEDILETLESMHQNQRQPRKKSQRSDDEADNRSETPLQTSRTRESVHTELTDYTMVTEEDENEENGDGDPIDVEKLKKEMRSAYLREWGDMRGMVFENDEEAELAFQNSKKKQSPPETPAPVAPPAAPPAAPVPAPPTEEVPSEEEVKVEQSSPPFMLQEEAKDHVTPLPSSRRPSRMTNRSRSSSKSSSSSSKARRKSSLFQTVGLLLAGAAAGAQNDHDSDEENGSRKDDYRQTFPPSELEALLGFFPELRSEISELLRQKRHLKLDISEWKAEFFLKNGREATWEERKREINEMYERYHEVGFKANKALKELREAEDDLLKSWETRRTKMTTRSKKQQQQHPQEQQQEAKKKDLEMRGILETPTETETETETPAKG
jgi:hypothetical protein